jgi:hypothetical protein
MCEKCGGRMVPVSGSTIRCIACGYQDDPRAKKKASAPVSAPYIQPGAESAATPGTKSPLLSTPCPTCGLTARRVGSAKYEWVCDNGHQFALNATGSNDFAALNVAKIGPISMGGQ